MTFSEQVADLITDDMRAVAGYSCDAIIKDAQRIDRTLAAMSRCETCTAPLSPGLSPRRFCRQHCKHENVIYSPTGDDICRDCGAMW